MTRKSYLALFAAASLSLIIYIGYRQSVLPSVKINTTRMQDVDVQCSAIIEYRKSHWNYPSSKSETGLDKLLKLEPTKSRIRYESAENGSWFILGVPLIMNDATRKGGMTSQWYIRNGIYYCAWGMENGETGLIDWIISDWNR